MYIHLLCSLMYRSLIFFQLAVVFFNKRIKKKLYCERLTHIKIIHFNCIQF